MMESTTPSKPGDTHAMTPPSSPCLTDSLLVKFTFSDGEAAKAQKILNSPPQPGRLCPSTELSTPSPEPQSSSATSSPQDTLNLSPDSQSPSSTSAQESQALSLKRPAPTSVKDQPKSKKSKPQGRVYDSEDTDADDVAAPASKKSRHDSKKAKLPSPLSDDEDSNPGEVNSENTMKRRPNLTADKPEPFGQPLMFAHNRGGLCETVHQFKANQGGAYRNTSRGPSMYFGILCDGGVYERDYFSDQVIICTIGGGRVMGPDGKAVLKADHADSHQLAVAARNSMTYKQAIILCVGQSNTKFPTKLTHYYNVLGYFHITDVWYDRYEKSCWVLRAEAIDLITRPSWSVKALPWVPSSVSAPRAPILRCSSCHQTTKEIYTIGWFCMIPTCSSYFQQSSKKVPLAGLQYTDVFLQERTQFQGEIPNEIAPVFPSHLTSGPATQGLNAEIKQGYVCPDCGCCSRRLRWNYFNCETPSCGTQFKIPRKVLTVTEVTAKKPKPTTTKTFFKDGIKAVTVTIGSYSVDVYDIPDARGNRQNCHIFHFKSNKKINGQVYGPDDLFSALQQEDLNLRRCPVRTQGSVVEMVTNHFTKNYGATYKFIAPQESDGFDVAPDIILRILMRNTWATKAAMRYLGAPFVAPNELLSLGYQNNNAIKYHDDGEKTLGPTVTSLSLGGGAVMKWRRKKILAGRGGDKTQAQKASGAVLQIYLQHGDFMVMNGTEIQKQFEHAVAPSGDLRFASTTRTILCEKIVDPAERAIAFKNGVIPDRAAYFEYDGDVALVSGLKE